MSDKLDINIDIGIFRFNAECTGVCSGMCSIELINVFDSYIAFKIDNAFYGVLGRSALRDIVEGIHVVMTDTEFDDGHKIVSFMMDNNMLHMRIDRGALSLNVDSTTYHAIWGIILGDTESLTTVSTTEIVDESYLRAIYNIMQNIFNNPASKITILEKDASIDIMTEDNRFVNKISSTMRIGITDKIISVRITDNIGREKLSCGFISLDKDAALQIYAILGNYLNNNGE